MSDISPLTSPRRIQFFRIPQLLFQPRRTLTEISAESVPSWLTPMLVLSITALLSVIVSGFLTSRAAMMGEMTLPPDWQYWTPEMQNNYMQAQQSMQGPVFVYIIPFVSAFVGLWLGWLILSGLLHLGSTLLGGRGSMAGALSMVGWAYLPFALRDLLRIVFMLLTGHAIASAGLSGFAENSAFLAQILSRTDLFYLWSAVLMVIGLGISDGLSRGKAVIAVAAILLLLLLAQAGIGSLLSGIGGIASANPIF